MQINQELKIRQRSLFIKKNEKFSPWKNPSGRRSFTDRSGKRAERKGEYEDKQKKRGKQFHTANLMRARKRSDQFSHVKSHGFSLISTATTEFPMTNFPRLNKCFFSLSLSTPENHHPNDVVLACPLYITPVLCPGQISRRKNQRETNSAPLCFSG